MTLVGDDANEIFGPCDSIDRDWSLHAIVRAAVLNSGVAVSDVAGKTTIKRHRIHVGSELSEMFGNYYNDEAISIVDCVGCFDTELAAREGWTNQFMVNGKACHIDQYLSQFGRTKIYVNEELKRLVAFVDRRATHTWVQALESILFRLMPWYYPADLSEDDKQFYRSIAVDNKAITAEEKAGILVQYVNAAAEKINFRDIRLHKMLDGIADRARQTRISSLKNDVEYSRNHIERCMSDLTDHYRTLDAKLLELNALELAEPEQDDSMFKFFNNHKQIKLLSVNDSGLRFGVDDTLEFYDEEEFGRLLGNDRSYLHEWDDQFRKALSDLFIEHKGVVRVNAIFNLQEFKLINPAQGDRLEDCGMPNPHIYFYGCSGGNGQYYSQYARSGDWDLAIEQAVSATKNVNWGDSTVCRRMLRWLNENNTPCIYVADDLQPIERVNSDMRLVSFRDFIKMTKPTEGGEANG